MRFVVITPRVRRVRSIFKRQRMTIIAPWGTHRALQFVLHIRPVYGSGEGEGQWGDTMPRVSPPPQDHQSNQMRIFNVARITGVVTKSTKVKSLCGCYSKMSGNDWRNKYVFSLWQKSAREADDSIRCTGPDSWARTFTNGWAREGSTMSKRIANKKLTKLYTDHHKSARQNH